MKILSWNVHGASRKRLKSQLKDLMRICNPDIILVMETRVNSGKAQLVLQILKIPNYVEIPPEGFTEGI